MHFKIGSKFGRCRNHTLNLTNTVILVAVKFKVLPNFCWYDIYFLWISISFYLITFYRLWYIYVKCYLAKIFCVFSGFIKHKCSSVKRDFGYNEARVFVMWYNLHIFVIDVMIMLQSIYYLPKHKSWPITKMHVFVVPQTNTAIVI